MKQKKTKIEMYKVDILLSKSHSAMVTETNLCIKGSLTLDTYLVKVEKGSSVGCLNSVAAYK